MSPEITIQNTLARWFVAIDTLAWSDACALMTTPFHVDYSSFGAGPPADVAPEEVLDGWAALLPGFEHTHHQLGNLQVEHDGDEARVRAYVVGTHVIGQDVWEVVGTYDLRLARSEGTWRMAGVTFHHRYTTGPADLPDRARKRTADPATRREAAAALG